jgi:hypothetical protein
VDTLTHALTWVACLALALAVNHYLQRWIARDDDETEPHDGTDDAEPDAAPPVVAPVAAPPTDRPWPRSVWSRRGPRAS